MSFRNLVLLILMAVTPSAAENLSIQFASPVAAQSYNMKRSAFVFRTLGCQSNPNVSATAEGRVGGKRRSIALKLAPGPAPNVFGIFPEWPNEGVWIVSIRAQCASKTAGALVATDAIKGLVRESSIALDHAATDAEVDAALTRGKKLDGQHD